MNRAGNFLATSRRVLIPCLYAFVSSPGIQWQGERPPLRPQVGHIGAPSKLGSDK
jgi:hypothetical protein